MNATATASRPTFAMVAQAVREYPGRTAGYYADLTSREQREVQLALDELVDQAAVQTVPGPLTGVTLYHVPACIQCGQATAGHGHFRWYCQGCANA